jgi:hypothetical protein
VAGEGQQIEGSAHHRQVLAAVAEVVLQVIAAVFQGIEAFVLDIPTRPASWGRTTGRSAPLSRIRLVS